MAATVLALVSAAWWADAERGAVEVVAVEHAVVEMAALSGIGQDLGSCSRMYSLALNRKPAVAQAGSQTSSAG